MKKQFLLLLIITVLTLSAFRQGHENSVYFFPDMKKSGITWEGRKTFGGHTGTIGLKEGSLFYNGEKITSATFTIDMHSINNTDLQAPLKHKLEEHLKSADFFDAANFPEAKFRLSKIETIRNDSAMATGDLTIKGITHPIRFAFTCHVKEGRMEIAANGIKVSRKRYGVEMKGRSVKTAMGNTAIHDDFTLGFSIVLFKK